jgi:hypothetical protein
LRFIHTRGHKVTQPIVDGDELCCHFLALVKVAITFIMMSKLTMKKQWCVLFAAMWCWGAAMGQTAAAPAAVVPTMYVAVEGAYFTPSGGSRVSGFHSTSRSRVVSAMRVLLGYRLSPDFDLELAYFTTGDYKQSATNGVASYNARLSAHGEDLALVYHFSETLPGMFVKAGLVQSKLDGAVVSTIRSRSSYATSTTSGLGYLAGLGYGIKLGGTFEARLGYTFYTNVGGMSNVKLHMLSAGLGYGF